MNIVVLLSGSGSNLQAIINGINAGRIPGQIVKVISNRPAVKGLERARNHNIDTTVIDHTHFSTRIEFDRALKCTIDDCQPDLIVLAGFMRVLSDEFVTHYQGKMLNIHPSLLPKFKGLNTHARAIEANESQHGCSVHFVSAKLDSGAIIGQAGVAIEANDTPETLSNKVQKQEHELYPTCVALFCAGHVKWSLEGVLYKGKPLQKTGLTLSELLT